MKQAMKLVLLRLSRGVGLFRLARFSTRKGLRILCYHGFTLRDESDFRPGLFIRPETFRRRMAYLAREKYPVLTLDEGYARLATGTLPDAAVVITIDDGFYSVGQLAWPILKAHSFPATLYVTSYYLGKPEPIFRLAVQYLFWKTACTHLDTHGLGLPVESMIRLDATAEAHAQMWDIIQFGESSLDEPGRRRLAAELGRRLGVSYEDLEKTRALTLLTAGELRALVQDGMDIQLHTHRHRLPEDAALTRREIQDNRRTLEPIVGKSLRHFCYPSGIWSRSHWPWLAAEQIATATTCDPGINFAGAQPLGLTRFLDSEEMAQLEFEAEVSGFWNLVRAARCLIRNFRFSRERAVSQTA